MKDVFEFIVIRFLEIRRFRGGGLSTQTTLEKAKFATIHIAEIEVFLSHLLVFLVIFQSGRLKSTFQFVVCIPKKKTAVCLKVFPLMLTRVIQL